MAHENPAFIRKITKEMKTLITSPIEGITIIPDERDLSEVQSFIAGPKDTPYEAGEFKIKLKFGSDYPSAPPKGFFLTKIFHPNISERGEICVNTLKRDWKESYGIKDILLTIKCLLIVPNPESSLNEEAGRLFQEHYEDYRERAALYTSIHAIPETKTQETTEKETEKTNNSETKENQFIDGNTTSQQSVNIKKIQIQAPNKKKAQTGAKRGVKRL